MKLYEYAIIYNPLQTQAQRNNGEAAKSVLVAGIKHLLANSEKEAQMLVAREIPSEYTDKLDRVEIALRPF